MRYPHTIFLCLLLLAGCQRTSGPRLMPAAGKVELDGQPLANAFVSFTPTGTTPGAGAEAMTDDAGEFELRSRRGGQGAPAGTYKVVISKLVKPDGSDVVIDDEHPPATSGGREALPPEYSSPSKTKLTATIGEGGTPLEFKLQSKKR
jgi:hypothetical protein